ncbi:MAG: hypothetical protein GXP62_02250 [Oligoflexia bacterium]|nr:hypothetical protein [Oligoflexia bacterium]
MYSLGLVLAGGAARGAYAAGVMRYLFRELPKNLGHVPWPQIVAGTSVGALNGVFAAAQDIQGVDRLSRLWQEMSVRQVYRVGSGGLIRTLRATWAATAGAAILDATPLYGLVQRASPWRALRTSISSGACRAFIVSCTQVDTGFNVLFLDSREPDLDLRPLPGARVVMTQVRQKHLLASAALPILFRPVKIDGAWFVDGGLRQNTPLRPALMAGADRVIVVGATSEADDKQVVRHPNLTPNIPFLAGKALNALLADPVVRDLRSAERVNRIIAWGVEHYGPDFADKLEADLDVRQSRTLLIRPSTDFGVLAAQRWRATPPPMPLQVRWLLSAMADRANASDGESDLLSYLFFDRAFTGEVERIGFEDARRQEEHIVEFLAEGD